jgi:hypothetical protein
LVSVVAAPDSGLKTNLGLPWPLKAVGMLILAQAMLFWLFEMLL